MKSNGIDHLAMATGKGSMLIFVPRETRGDETRAPVLPETAEKLVKLGAHVEVESGLGSPVNVSDDDYLATGATIGSSREKSLEAADLVLRLNKPPAGEIDCMKQGCIQIGFLDPFNEPELISRLAAGRVTAISIEMIPRITLAQKMDALSSQASLAGYAAALIAAERLNKVFPMMTTPAGTIAPSRVFVVGAGVAGLQAIATAKRLGARVEAFDTRPIAEEQVRSLGARFVTLDIGDTGETKGGYARELTEEQIAKQREEMAKHCANADVVITTAQVFGKKAPVIITSEMVRRMKPGSVVVDCAVQSGGNVEGVQPDKEVEVDGVRIIALTNLPGRVAYHASQMYSANLGSLVEHLWDGEAGRARIDMDDEITKACVITHGGEIVNDTIRKLMG